MDSNTLFSPVSPVTQYTTSPSSQRSANTYLTPAHEGLQAVEPEEEHHEVPDSPESGPQNPYTYRGRIQPDVVRLSALGDKYGDDNLLPSYPERKKWGLPIRTFWTIVGVVVVLLLIVIGVGAGVGATQAAKHSREGMGSGASRLVHISLLPFVASPGLYRQKSSTEFISHVFSSLTIL